MNRKKLVLLLASLVVAIGTALIARNLLVGGSAPTAQAAPVELQGPKVLVAKRSLPVGTIITADAVGYQLWPQELVQDAYFIDGETDMGKLLGTVVRFPVTAGEPVTQGSLVAPGDRGFLAAALGPGMRAVTVTVTAGGGVAGFVFPGDRVDLVLTQSIDGEGQSLKASETILRNLRVLATDQSTETATGEDGKIIVQGFSMVTLEVTPIIAEKIAVAETIGTLSLSLRSIADNQSELERAIAEGDVDLPDNVSQEEEERLLRAAVSRPREGRSSVQTGGDVSRFQRTTMPPMSSYSASSPATAQPPALPYPQTGPGALVGAPTGPAGNTSSNGTSAYSGPTVRVSRGKTTTLEPIRSGTGALLDRPPGSTR